MNYSTTRSTNLFWRRGEFGLEFGIPFDSANYILRKLRHLCFFPLHFATISWVEREVWVSMYYESEKRLSLRTWSHNQAFLDGKTQKSTKPLVLGFLWTSFLLTYLTFMGVVKPAESLWAESLKNDKAATEEHCWQPQHSPYWFIVSNKCKVKEHPETQNQSSFVTV